MTVHTGLSGRLGRRPGSRPVNEKQVAMPSIRSVIGRKQTELKGFHGLEKGFTSGGGDSIVFPDERNLRSGVYSGSSDPFNP